MKRYDRDHHGDDHFMTESEDGDWVRWEDAQNAHAREVAAVARAEGLLQACTEAGQRTAALEAEVARLRQMYQDALRTVASSNEACATERAAHEATKAERDLMQSQRAALARRVLELEDIKPLLDGLALKAAEQRVAELELSESVLKSMVERQALNSHAQREALSSARELLEEVDREHGHRTEDTSLVLSELADKLLVTLRAHPEHATPALKPLALVEDRTPEQLAADGDSKPREPRCECQLEEGDSPCPVHGLDEPATPAAPGAEAWPMHMDCPSCGKEHVDELDPATGIDWSVRPHKTHLCLGCGHKWKPSAFNTVGVARAEKEQ